MKKFAVSGTISAVFFAGFLYFVYDAESAKYEEKKTGEPTKQYEENIIAQVNSEVAQTMEGLSREGYARAEWQTPSTRPHDQNRRTQGCGHGHRFRRRHRTDTRTTG